MTSHRTRAFALMVLAGLSLGMKELKYRHDRQVLAHGQDVALKHLMARSGYQPRHWEVSHGGMAGSYRFTRQGCPDLLVLSLRNSEDGVVSAYRERVNAAVGRNTSPVYVIEGRVYTEIPYGRLYTSLVRDEARRLLDLPRYPASFMSHPDPRSLPALCRPELTWATYRV